MRKGKLIHTARSGHGYLFDDEINESKTVRVRLLDPNFELTGKTLRAKMSTLDVIGSFIT